MKESHWFKRLEIALEFDSGFEIFLLLGRGELARPALAAIAEQLQRFGTPSWHRLHIDDLDSLLTTEQPGGVVHLVHGFERMPAAAAANLAARLNLNRDRLEVLAGPVIFWIAEDFYEELLRQAPDFVAWRSQATLVSDIESLISPDVAAEERLLCHAQIEAGSACADLPPLDIIDAGRRPILDWLTETSTRSFRYSVDDHPLRVAKWCAWQLARLREAGSYGWVPALLPSLLLTDMTGVGDGIGRLWEQGALHLVVAAPLSTQEFETIVAGNGENRLLAPVFDGNSAHASIAGLTDPQIAIMIERSFADLGRHEFEQWRIVMMTTLRLFEDRICRVGVLAAVISHWRHLGLSSVQRGLESRGWREHSFRSAVSCGVDLEANEVSETLIFGPEVFPQPDVLALKLYEFGKRMREVHQSSEAEKLLRASISLFRAEGRSRPRPAFVDALISLARNLEFDHEQELLIWREAVSVARQIEPLDSRLLIGALDGLALCSYLCRLPDEAERTLSEAIALVDESVHDPVLRSQLLCQQGQVFYEQERCEEAILLAKEALRILPDDGTKNSRLLRIELWQLCDACYSDLGLHQRAREAAAQVIELRRPLSTQLWLRDLEMWGERLLEAGELEQARAVVTEATQASGGGIAYPFTLLAKIHWALDQRAEAIEAIEEAVRINREGLDDGYGSWWTRELAQALLTLSSYLAQLQREDEALHVAREAVTLLEQDAERQPAQYPADLVSALRQLGDLAASHQQFEIAAGAYARILTLAEPFPARTSDPVLEVELRLEEVQDLSDIQRGS